MLLLTTNSNDDNKLTSTPLYYSLNGPQLDGLKQAISIYDKLQMNSATTASNKQHNNNVKELIIV